MTNSLASFEQWSASTYLEEYYSSVETDEQYTLAFLIAQLEGHSKQRGLEFGAGPTLHRAIAMSAYVNEINFADYLQDNLNIARLWQEQSTLAHNWNPFTRYILECEGRAADETSINAREELTRLKLAQYLQGDIRSTQPLGAHPTNRPLYDLVICCYCADGITQSKQDWFTYMRNVSSLVAPGGLFLTAALRNCSQYRVAGLHFPCANVNETDMETSLNSCQFTDIQILVRDVPDLVTHGYESIVMAAGVATV